MHVPPIVLDPKAIRLDLTGDLSFFRDQALREVRAECLCEALERRRVYIHSRNSACMLECVHVYVHACVLSACVRVCDQAGG